MPSGGSVFNPISHIDNSIIMPLDTIISDYTQNLTNSLATFDWKPVETLGKDLINIWNTPSTVFFCGNGGSAANANHLANDFIYGIAPKYGKGLNVHSLSANSAVMTCLGNDIGYEAIYEKQLNSLAKKEDILIAFSGSGNSENIVRAIELAKDRGVKTHAILGFDGGKCKSLADNAIHLDLNDMQISEDFQMIIGHILMKYLTENEKKVS